MPKKNTKKAAAAAAAVIVDITSAPPIDKKAKRSRKRRTSNLPTKNKKAHSVGRIKIPVGIVSMQMAGIRVSQQTLKWGQELAEGKVPWMRVKKD